jgi:hypothetical protein
MAKRVRLSGKLMGALQKLGRVDEPRVVRAVAARVKREVGGRRLESFDSDSLCELGRFYYNAAMALGEGARAGYLERCGECFAVGMKHVGNWSRVGMMLQYASRLSVFGGKEEREWAKCELAWLVEEWVIRVPYEATGALVVQLEQEEDLRQAEIVVRRAIDRYEEMLTLLRAERARLAVLQEEKRDEERAKKEVEKKVGKAKGAAGKKKAGRR